MRCALLFIAVTVLGVPAAAQEPPAPPPPPPAARADVASVDAIIAAVYDVISGPAGPREWNRFRSLFAPGARLIPTGRAQDGSFVSRVWSPEEYAEQAEQWFSQNAFYEVELHRSTETYGHLVHAFSTYASRRVPTEDPFVRGINSMQLMHDGSRWWILSIMWADETAAGDIPARYLAGGP